MSKAQNNVDESVIKRPGNDAPLTKKQQEEWLRCADDPFYFFTKYCMVRGSKGKTLFAPREYQKDLLDVVIDNTHTVVISPRQSGKCCHQNSLLRVKIDGVEHKTTIGELHDYVAGRKDSTLPEPMIQ